MLLFVPEGNFKFFVLEKQIGPLCTGGCEKLVYIAEILVTLGVLRSPARFFLNKRCSFDMRDSETTVLVSGIHLLNITEFYLSSPIPNITKIKSLSNSKYSPRRGQKEINPFAMIILLEETNPHLVFRYFIYNQFECV